MNVSFSTGRYENFWAKCQLSSVEAAVERKRPVISAAVRVFDLEKGEWRSFRFDSLQKEPYKLGEAQ